MPEIMPLPVAKSAPTQNGVPRFDSIADTVEAFRRGDFIVVMDSTSRENEGDLIIAAEHMTPAKMAFMVRHTSGLICAPMSVAHTRRLQLPQMVPDNQERHGTAYTVSTDVSEGTTTGISASDRALTVKALANPDSRPSDFRRPGHVFPLRAVDGGVLVRTGHTEASIDFCRLAGLQEVAVICELVKEWDLETGEGGMMRRDDCLAFAKKWGLKIATIEDLHDHLVERDGHSGLAAATNGIRNGVNGTSVSRAMTNGIATATNGISNGLTVGHH